MNTSTQTVSEEKQPVPETRPLEITAEQERTRLAKLLFDRIPYMASDYESLMKYTGGFLSKSMAVAYQKGLNDALKLLLKGEK